MVFDVSIFLCHTAYDNRMFRYMPYFTITRILKHVHGIPLTVKPPLESRFSSISGINRFEHHGRTTY